MPEILPDLVSTIIPVYNRGPMLIRAVESVLTQTYRPIEIIISDDGSTDDTVEVAGQLVRAHPQEIRLICNENRGAGPAREAGRQLAKGEFIQYLDSDDRLLPQKFEIQVGALKKHPECGAAYGFIRFCPEGDNPYPHPYKRSGETFSELFPLLLVDRWWNTDCPLYRRTVCDAVGAWTDLRYSQDWEYDGRVGALRTRLIHCRDYVCEQHHHAEIRQTGHGRWLDPESRARFFCLMFGHAKKAGVNVDTPEMKHFSRWLFFHARDCGAMGAAASAKACYNLAVESAARLTSDLKLYGLIARCFGWTSTGRIFSRVSRLSGRAPGPHTLTPSSTIR